MLPLLLCLLAPTGCLQEPKPREPVRLIVLVVVDQMIPEQLERLAPYFHGGLARFAAGEVHREAAHAHGVTETGPGHAALGTGVHPSRNGIVGNSWSDRERGNAPVYCSGDAGTGALTSEGAGPPSTEGRSPANLLADGFAAHLRARCPGSRSIGIAGKDRAATLTPGSEADWALWWDRSTGGGFQSSTYYGEELPAWVLEWNAAWWEGLSAFEWKDELPAGLERAGTAADARAGESRSDPVFPHRARFAWETGSEPGREARVGLARWAYVSPLVDRFVCELAQRAVVAEDLGGDDQVDFLFVGLSACDTVGHGFGPYSREVTDLLLRVDADLGRLFDLLDERVGAERWMAALSSDHGVLPLPETLAPRGYDAVRLPGSSFGSLLGAIDRELAAVLGTDYLLGPATGQGLLLDREALARDGVDPEEVGVLADEIARSLSERVVHVYSGPELLREQTEPGADPLLLVLSRSFHPTRSADLLPVLRPWTLFSDSGTTHGSPWPYDRRVPLAFLGPGSVRGPVHSPCWTVDVLPTLFARAGLTVPEGLDGRVLR